WRVVVVRDAQALAISPRLRATVEDVLEKPPPGLALILSAELPPKTKAKFWDRLIKEATAVEYPALDAADLPGWLAEWAVTNGFRVEPEAARLLVAAVGTDLGVLLQEMTKLGEGAGAGGTVDRAAVEAGVGAIRRQDRWAWFDLVGSGDLATARAALPVLLDAGESGVGLVIGLGAQLLRLAVAAAGGERALAGALPRHQQWLARRLMSQARRWTPEALDGALDDLLRADRLLKSASLDDRQVMDELLLRMEGRRRGLAA
ncbi:MAG TPA: DNA polymerase III subunit delta, partial [Longimicrobiales bacterium]|nr:DNA polymerase III subunit delta [Longimicrobiales bacterium]